MFGLIFVLSNRRLCAILDGKSLQEYPVNARVPQGSILCLTLFLLYINDLMILCVILLSMLTILLSIRHLICGNSLNWLLNLNLIYKTLDWGKKWFVDFNAGKTQLVLFHVSNNNGSIDVKMDRSALQEKSSFKMLGLTFSSKFDWGSYIIYY